MSWQPEPQNPTTSVVVAVNPSALVRRLVVEGLHRAISGRPEVELLRHQVVELEERLTAQTKAFTQRLDEISEILEKHNREVAIALTSTSANLEQMS